MALLLIVPVVSASWLAVALADSGGLKLLVLAAMVTVVVGGSAVLMAIVVVWADRGSKAQRLVAVLGSVAYAAFTVYLYVVLTSRDPLAGFAVLWVPVQWAIIGVVALVVRVMSPIAWDLVASQHRARS